MQGYKSNYRGGDRGGSRPHHRNASDQQAKPFNDAPPSGIPENAAATAARAINLKLLLQVVNDDTAQLAMAVDLPMNRLQLMLDGHIAVNNGVAMHIEETIGLPQSWMDRKHVLEEIGDRTRKILLGEESPDAEHPLHSVEQQGHAIMKKTAATTSPAEKETRPAAPVADSRQQELPHVENSGASETASGSEVKTVADLIPLRVNNLRLLTQARGAKTKMAKALNVSESFISFLFNGKKDFTSELARSIEKAAGLPGDWMDWEHVANDVPKSAWDMLGTPAEPNATTPLAAAAAAAPAPASAPAPAAKPEDVSAALGDVPGFSLNLSSAPSILAAPQEPMADAARVINEAKAPKAKAAVKEDAKEKEAGKEAAPATKTVTQPAAAKTPKAPAAASKTVTAQKPAATPAPAPATPAPIAAPVQEAAPQPVAQTATPAAQPSPAPAQGNALALTEEAPTSFDTPVDILPPSKTNIAAMQLLQPDVLGIGPMTEALIKTLIMRARKNELTERDAYRMLGEVNGFIDQ